MIMVIEQLHQNGNADKQLKGKVQDLFDIQKMIENYTHKNGLNGFKIVQNNTVVLQCYDQQLEVIIYEMHEDVIEVLEHAMFFNEIEKANKLYVY